MYWFFWPKGRLLKLPNGLSRVRHSSAPSSESTRVPVGWLGSAVKRLQELTIVVSVDPPARLNCDLSVRV